MKKKVAVLGATGSIGKSTLDVLRKGKERFEPVFFSAHSNGEELLLLKKEFPGVLTALSDNKAEKGPGIDFTGKQGLLDAIAAAKADITVNGISGAEGLEPSIAVLNAGSDLALANKETVVMAGHIIFALAGKKNVRVIPVDSEHSAIFKLIEAHGKDNVLELILTASGGPFRKYSAEQLSGVKPIDALAHPTWNMGRKISIDSATMANKGLEVIEAAKLFGFAPEKIKVVIHPQSIVHSMIRLKNGALYAQLSNPDMRLPIHDALSWPETDYSSFGSLEFDSLSLSFEKPDFKKFPMLKLAYEALGDNPLLPVVYNASNEIAVDAFVDGKIGFPEISRVVEYVMTHDLFQNVNPAAETGETIETILDRDKKARELANNYIYAGSR